MRRNTMSTAIVAAIAIDAAAPAETINPAISAKRLAQKRDADGRKVAPTAPPVPTDAPAVGEQSAPDE